MQAKTLIEVEETKVLTVPGWPDEYLAMNADSIRPFNIQELADEVNAYSGLAPEGPLFRAGKSPREHRSLILLACSARRLLEWLDSCQQETP